MSSGSTCKSSDGLSFVVLKVRNTDTAKNSASTMPITKNGVFDADVILLPEPNMPRIKTAMPKAGTIPAELNKYPTELYCVLKLYSGASSGSMAVCGTLTMVYAVL